MAKKNGFVKSLASIFDYASEIAIVIFLAVTVVNVVLRTLFGTPIAGSIEMVCYGSMIMALLAMPGCELDNGNICVTFLLESLPKKAVKALNVFATVFMLIGTSVVTYMLYGQISKKLSTGVVTSALRMPLYIFVILITIGFALVALSVLYKLAILLFKKENIEATEVVSETSQSMSLENK